MKSLSYALILFVFLAGCGSNVEDGTQNNDTEATEGPFWLDENDARVQTAIARARETYGHFYDAAISGNAELQYEFRVYISEAGVGAYVWVVVDHELTLNTGQLSGRIKEAPSEWQWMQPGQQLHRPTDSVVGIYDWRILRNGELVEGNFIERIKMTGQ